MIVSKTVRVVQDVCICDRCKLDPNPAPMHSIVIRVGQRVRADGLTARGDLCEDCIAIIFRGLGILVPVPLPEAGDVRG